ncbi:MAG: peptide chain release factor N(5)-glutamine methyltransferase [Lachnospiraceae bacterium]
MINNIVEGNGMTYRELLQQGSSLLKENGIEEYELDARLLLEDICNTDRNYLLLHGQENVPVDKELQYREYIEKRREHFPLQYILGEQEFMGLSFSVTPDVLIPRQDTEILVEAALHLTESKSQGDVLDICTGSGCILISFLEYKKRKGELWNGVGTDISERALSIAGENGRRLNSLAKFELTDLTDGIAGQYDVILSNPPYIPPKVIATLMPEVKDHEPRLALDGGEDGLDFYRRIAGESRRLLKPDGILLLEIGAEQGKDVAGILEKSGFSHICVKKDYADLDRVVIAYPV